MAAVISSVRAVAGPDMFVSVSRLRSVASAGVAGLRLLMGSVISNVRGVEVQGGFKDSPFHYIAA